MPIEYAISIELNLKITRWRGEVDIGEYRDLFAAYLEDENYRLGRPEICDFSAMTNLDADFARIWSVLTMVNAQAGGAHVNTRCVIYAPDDTTYGLARMYQSLAENANGVQVAVFREEAEVLAHLDLPGTSLADLRKGGNFLPPNPKAGEPALLP